MRNLSRHEKIKLINRLASEGRTARQIANDLGVTPQRLGHIAKRHGIQLPYRGSVRFSAWTSYRRGAVINALARAAEVSPGVMVDRMIASIVDDGEELARKRLGKLALPRESMEVRNDDCRFVFHFCRLFLFFPLFQRSF